MNLEHPDYKTANWRFRGELPAVTEFDGMPRDTIKNGTAGGWPMVITIDRFGNYIF